MSSVLKINITKIFIYHYFFFHHHFFHHFSGNKIIIIIKIKGSKLSYENTKILKHPHPSLSLPSNITMKHHSSALKCN